jgi:hypothetical protein
LRASRTTAGVPLVTYDSIPGLTRALVLSWVVALADIMRTHFRRDTDRSELVSHLEALTTEARTENQAARQG